MRLLPLLFNLLFGYLGYREAARFARSTGRAPWGWPPVAWSLCTGASLFLGGLLLIIARRTTDRRPRPARSGDRPASSGSSSRDILPSW